jgi:hypothetical protein
VKRNEDDIRNMVTSELLNYSTLVEGKVLERMKKYQFGLCLCVHEGELNDDLDLVCKTYEKAGIPIVFWPLISISKGLYLNKYSIRAYDRYLDQVFQWLKERNLKIHGLLVDCEPDYELPRPNSLSPVLDNVWDNLKDMDEAAFKAAIKGFGQIIKKIKAQGYKAIGAALPFVCDDVLEKSQAWQDYWGGPVIGLDWDMIVFMLFGSWFVQMGMNWPTAHWLVYDYTRAIKKIWRSKALVALGVTTPGTGAETAIYRSPEELAAAVSVVRAAGIQRIGIYDLKGIMESEDPDAWFLQILNARPLKPDARSLRKGRKIEYIKIGLYKCFVKIIGKILEQIRYSKTIVKQFFLGLRKCY